MEATALKMAAEQRADELLAMLENAQQLVRAEAEGNAKTDVEGRAAMAQTEVMCQLEIQMEERSIRVETSTKTAVVDEAVAGQLEMAEAEAEALRERIEELNERLEESKRDLKREYYLEAKALRLEGDIETLFGKGTCTLTCSTRPRPGNVNGAAVRPGVLTTVTGFVKPAAVRRLALRKPTGSFFLSTQEI